MNKPMILASSSEIRRNLLTNAGLKLRCFDADIDEKKLREKYKPTDFEELPILLASAKAEKISKIYPESIVIGCDQILELNGAVLNKPNTKPDAVCQLSRLSGNRHRLYSAAVVFEAGLPIWHTVGVATLAVRILSKSYINDYVGRNWDSIRHSVGCYKLEEEGVRLFSKIDGDYFTILGLPLLELLGYLAQRRLIKI